MVPDREQATLIRPDGVWTQPGVGLDPLIARGAAAALIGSLRGRIVTSITDPTARGGNIGCAAIRPGTLALA